MNRCIAAMLCLFALIAPLPGCSSSGTIKVEPIKTPAITIGGGEVTWQTGDEEWCLRGQFLDKDGNPIGPEVGGGSSGTMPIPTGAAYIKFWLVKCEEAIPAGPVHPAQLKTYLSGIVSVDDQTAPMVHYGLGAMAKNEAQAHAKMNAIIQGGPGTPVGADVKVYSFVEFTAGASVSTIETSLPNTFRSVQVTVNGTVVADLISGLNCTVINRANNWQTVQISLPTSIAPAGSVVELTQVGAPGAEQELSAEMTL